MSLLSDLPELLRGYPPAKRDDARELAYSLLAKFMGDDAMLTRLRFALEAQEDLREAFYARPVKWG